MEILKSKIMLCKGIKLDKDYVNVLNYSESDMVTLCESKAVATASDYSFIRNTGRINTNFKYDDALECDYIAFQNKDYSNKWFFAFLDDVVYKGENNTELVYTVDVWSTWFSYWTAKPCFVVREHVNDDTIGLHTIPENLACNDFVCEDSYSSQDMVNLGDLYYVALLTSYIPKDNTTGNEQSAEDRGTSYSGISCYNKNIFGKRIILFSAVNDENSAKSLTYFIRRINMDKGNTDDIEAMFIVPQALFPSNSLTSHTAYMSSNTYPFTFYTVPFSTTTKNYSIEVNKPASFSGITIKNNKCFTYPYCYLYVTNNAGNNNIYKFENFYNSNKAKFDLDVALSVGVSGKLTPINYKKIDDALIDNAYDDEAIPLAKFPTCAWTGDAYINWLTQNAVNIPFNSVLNLFGSGMNSYSNIQSAKTKAQETGTQANTFGLEAGLAINIASSVANVIGEFYTASLLPNITSGSNTGDVNFTLNKNRFMLRTMRVKDEELYIIDDFFTRFGYKVNRLKTPNITGRTYWNYVEIASSEEVGEGELPAKYMSMINSICQKGVTIWHSHANMGNYALNNTIVS